VEGDRRAGDRVDPFHVAEQVVEEGEPAQLPVVDDVEPDPLLHGDRLVDGAVLDPLELTGIHQARVERGTCLRQVARTQQRADHVGVKGAQHCHPPVHVVPPPCLHRPRRARKSAARRAAGPWRTPQQRRPAARH
jgi:hypothetical protein